MDSNFLSCLSEFREHLQKIVRTKDAKEKLVPDMKIYNLAVTVWQLGWGGFTPFKTIQSTSKKAKVENDEWQGELFYKKQCQQEVKNPSKQVGDIKCRNEYGKIIDGIQNRYSILQRSKEDSIQNKTNNFTSQLPVRRDDIVKRSFAPVGLAASENRHVSSNLTNSSHSPSFLGGSGAGPAVSGAELRSEARVQQRERLPQYHGKSFYGAEDDTQLMHEPIGNRGGMTDFDIGQALEEYFFQQSRLPPAGAAAFDPRLTPLWAGLKIPG
jgi:hypothetical protein